MQKSEIKSNAPTLLIGKTENIAEDPNEDYRSSQLCSYKFKSDSHMTLDCYNCSISKLCSTSIVSALMNICMMGTFKYILICQFVLQFHSSPYMTN